jgi:hypothetical protein
LPLGSAKSNFSEDQSSNFHWKCGSPYYPKWKFLNQGAVLLCPTAHMNLDACAWWTKQVTKSQMLCDSTYWKFLDQPSS